MTFLEELRQQRWDDHRFYHHNRVNQFLHLLSASCFIVSYALVFYYPAGAALIGWLLAMVLRQTGHFFFEPKTYDAVNQASHDYKESVKVGYNLRRKMVLIAVWLAAPIVLYFEPNCFGLFTGHAQSADFINNMAILWLYIGLAAVMFRTVHLFKLMGVQSGLVWCCKIITDPLHDIKIYYKSPYYLLKGDMYDEMRDWYDKSLIQAKL